MAQDQPHDWETEPRVERHPAPAAGGDSALAWSVRALARLWVVSLLLMTAAVAAISVYQLLQTQQELAEVRSEPGAAAYAVVAYRRELERQIEEMQRDEADYVASESLPVPPERPWLLIQIDTLRERNAEERRAAQRAVAADTARPRRGEPLIPE